MLEITTLNKTYDNGVHALNNVSLSIPKGMYGLLGPNGAGKSSLMRTIATLQDADSGSIKFDGIDVLNNPIELRRRLGYLPQSFGVYPRISALDLLNHLAILKGLVIKTERREVVEGLLVQYKVSGRLGDGGGLQSVHFYQSEFCRGDGHSKRRTAV
jgi:ABC-type multidrug transport system ATPase subunit